MALVAPPALRSLLPRWLLGSRFTSRVSCWHRSSSSCVEFVQQQDPWTVEGHLQARWRPQLIGSLWLPNLPALVILPTSLLLEASVLWDSYYYLHEPTSPVCSNSPSHALLCASCSRNSPMGNGLGCGIQSGGPVPGVPAPELGREWRPSLFHEIGALKRRQHPLFLLCQNNHPPWKYWIFVFFEPKGSWKQVEQNRKEAFQRTHHFHEIFLQNTT